MGSHSFNHTGVIPILATPFHDDESLDLERGSDGFNTGFAFPPPAGAVRCNSTSILAAR